MAQSTKTTAAKKSTAAKTAPVKRAQPEGALQDALRKVAPAVKAVTAKAPAGRRTNPKIDRALAAADAKKVADTKPATAAAHKPAKNAGTRHGVNVAKRVAAKKTQSQRTLVAMKIPKNTPVEQAAKIVDATVKDVTKKAGVRRPTRAALKAKAEALIKEAAGWGLVLSIPLEDGKPVVKLYETAGTVPNAA